CRRNSRKQIGAIRSRTCAWGGSSAVDAGKGAVRGQGWGEWHTCLEGDDPINSPAVHEGCQHSPLMGKVGELIQSIKLPVMCHIEIRQSPVKPFVAGIF